MVNHLAGVVCFYQTSTVTIIQNPLEVAMHLSDVYLANTFKTPLSFMGNPNYSGTTIMSAERQNAHKSETIHKILVAEDSKTEQVHLKQLLESSGYEVVIVESGQEALISLDDFKPDLILMDIIMEGGDGYQTCRKIKKNESTRDIPIIMVSSKSNEVDRKWALKLGALDYIVKPYTDTELLNRLSEV